MRKFRVFSVVWIVYFLFLTFSCKKDGKTPPINEYFDWDVTKINDSSLNYPANYLLSAAIPNPTATDLAKPVVIAAHGYSASTFEWTEFKDWAKTKNDFYVSVVLLGGHGRDYDDFKHATWEDWQAPIITEYNKLRDLGYKNINIVASSTGGPLVLNMVRNEKVKMDVLKHVYLIDPLIIPANKTLSLVVPLGLFIPYIKTDLDPGEKGHWYQYRPEQSLKQLEKFARQERKAIEKGYTLPAGVSMKVYKSKHDGSVDPLSAVQLHKGIKNDDGENIPVKLVESKLHVFTRVHGRSVQTSDDKTLQLQTFEEIHAEL
jgi:carboxylesterase